MTLSSREAVAAVSVVVCCVVLSACARGGDRAGSARTPTVRDSAGVSIVDVPGVLLDSLPEWHFSSEPTLSIGAVTGEAPYLFQRVSAARRLSTKEIMVTDQSLELRIFGADGAFVRSYGRRGSGPGEFEGYPISVSEIDGDSVAIFDTPRENVTSINLLTGDFTTRKLSNECRAADDTEMHRCDITKLLPNGNVFVSRSAPQASTVGGSAPAPRPSDARGALTVKAWPPNRHGLLKDTTFHVLETVASFSTVQSGVGSTFFSGEALFEPGGQVAFNAHGFITGDPKTYELRRRAADGSLTHIIRVSAEPQPVTSAMLSEHLRWADTAKTTPVAKEYLASLRPEGHVPYFGALRLDRSGRIWIRNYRAPSWWGPRPPLKWTILDSTGMPLARMQAMPRGDILEVGEDYIIMKQTDDEGVEFVRVYGLLVALGEEPARH